MVLEDTPTLLGFSRTTSSWGLYSSNTAILDPALGINWIAYAKDANGCIAQDAITLLIDPLPAITSLPNVCFRNTNNHYHNGAGVGTIAIALVDINHQLIFN
jgi:hypothetical protein